MRKKHLSMWGFSLVEVNLAVALIGIGLLSLFALFPMGLRESEFSLIDTQEATFADNVLSTVRGNAMEITRWEDWCDGSQSGLETFGRKVLENMNPIMDGSMRGNEYVASDDELGGGIYYPFITTDEYAAPRKIRYRLKIKAEGAMLRKVELWVKSGEYGNFDDNCSIYFAEVFYMGM